MMTFDEAKKMVIPILVSCRFRTDRALQDKISEIKRLLKPGEFDFSNNQVLLDEEKEKAFRELVAMYKGVDIHA